MRRRFRDHALMTLEMTVLTVFVACLVLATAAGSAASKPKIGSEATSADESVVNSEGAASNEDVLALGRLIFTEIAEPSCAICHTLTDAEAEGMIGPDLDDLALDIDRVRAAVTFGVGVMPAFQDSLTQEQIESVAAYVAGRKDREDADEQ